MKHLKITLKKFRCKCRNIKIVCTWFHYIPISLELFQWFWKLGECKILLHSIQSLAPCIMITPMWPLNFCQGLQVMEMLLWVCNAMSRRSKSGSVSIYMVDMVAFNEDFKMTQESMELSQGQDVRKLKGKGPKEGKSAYNHYGIFCTWILWPLAM